MCEKIQRQNNYIFGVVFEVKTILNAHAFLYVVLYGVTDARTTDNKNNDIFQINCCKLRNYLYLLIQTCIHICIQKDRHRGNMMIMIITLVAVMVMTPFSLITAFNYITFLLQIKLQHAGWILVTNDRVFILQYQGDISFR